MADFIVAPDALLFIAPGCPHCPAVLHALSELVKESSIGKLTVVNAAVHPELAAEKGVRTAPWLRLGSFVLTGVYSADELGQWAKWAINSDGDVHYVEHLLKQGGFRQAALFIAEDTRRLKQLLAVVADPAANLEVRLGASALLESYSGKEALQKLLPDLATLARHSDHRVRADACHLLGLTGSAAARASLAACASDENQEVREIAQEALEKLEGA